MKRLSQKELLEFKRYCELALKSDRYKGIALASDSLAVIKELLLARARLHTIAKIIWNIDDRRISVDGPVTSTEGEITNDEILKIYTLAWAETRP